jgi:hypothetical protein
MPSLIWLVSVMVAVGAGTTCTVAVAVKGLLGLFKLEFDNVTVVVPVRSLVVGATVAVIWVGSTMFRLDRGTETLPVIMETCVAVQPFALFAGIKPVPVMVTAVDAPAKNAAA